MKIYCNKKDDLIAERDQYDAETKRLEDIINEGQQKWLDAQDAVFTQIADAVRSEIGETSLPLNIDVDTRFRDGIQVKVEIDRYHDPNENDRALSWDWTARLNRDGEIVKDSGSWSGLQAVTEAQLNNLKESVRVLTVLNNIDWPTLLHTEVPAFDSFVDKSISDEARSRRANRADYNKLILDAEIEEAIESGDWIKLNGRPETDYFRGMKGTFWCKILKATEKFVTCYILRDLDGNVDLQRATPANEERISKEKLYKNIVTPVETAKFD